MLVVVDRRAVGLAKPIVRLRIELARCMERDATVALSAIGFGQVDALPFPGGADFAGIAARRALESVERELAAARPLPGKLALCKRARRIAIDTRKLAWIDARVRRHV